MGGVGEMTTPHFREDGKLMRPVIILPTGEVSKKDLRELRKNGFCVVEAKAPGLVRFLEPPPQDYSMQEEAAIKLCRSLLDKTNTLCLTRQEIASKYALIIIDGTPLAVSVPAPVERVAK